MIYVCIHIHTYVRMYVCMYEYTWTSLDTVNASMTKAYVVRRRTHAFKMVCTYGESVCACAMVLLQLHNCYQ